METIRTLLIDNEPLARRHLAQLLAGVADFAVVGECRNGAEAVAALQAGPAVDLLFLDVQLPDSGGLQALQQLRPRGGAPPLVVFATAHDCYTLQAFEMHAVDYLLKPLDPDRFGRCLAHVRHLLAQRRRAAQLTDHPVALLRDGPAAERPGAARPADPARRLLIKQQGRLFFVPTQQVRYVEATGNYVAIHAGDQIHAMRTTLNQLASQLDPHLFLRIHRSFIVNLSFVKELRPWAHGEYLITLHDGMHLASSRSYSLAIQGYMKRLVC